MDQEQDEAEQSEYNAQMQHEAELNAAGEAVAQEVEHM